MSCLGVPTRDWLRVPRDRRAAVTGWENPLAFLSSYSASPEARGVPSCQSKTPQRRPNRTGSGVRFERAGYVAMLYTCHPRRRSPAIVRRLQRVPPSGGRCCVRARILTGSAGVSRGRCPTRTAQAHQAFFQSDLRYRSWFRYNDSLRGGVRTAMAFLTGVFASGVADTERRHGLVKFVKRSIRSFARFAREN